MASTLASQRRESAPPITLRSTSTNLVRVDAEQVAHRITADEDDDDVDTNEEDKDEDSDTDDE